jgi:hypothetical protein
VQKIVVGWACVPFSRSRTFPRYIGFKAELDLTSGDRVRTTVVNREREHTALATAQVGRAVAELEAAAGRLAEKRERGILRGEDLKVEIDNWLNETLRVQIVLEKK